MPTIKLASQRSSMFQPSGQLRGSFVSSGSVMGIQRPYIPVNAGNMQYTPAPVPKIPIDTTLSSMAQFADVYAQSAFRYQQREAKVFADQATMKYREELEKGFRGYEDKDGNFVKGYSNYEREEAILKYGDFQDYTNTKMKEILEALPESSRQKAMLSMSSIRSSYLGHAAVHRATQLKAAEKATLDEKRRDTVRAISSDPSLITRVDPATGLTGKEEFLGHFKDPIAGREAWANLIQETTEKIYLEQGLKKAQEFYKNVARAELMESPKQATSTLSNITRWEHEAVRAYNSTIDLQIKRAKQAQEKLWNDTMTRIEVDRANNILWSRDEIQNAMKAGIMDPKYGRAYIREEYEHFKWVPDYEQLNEMDDRIIAASKNNFIDPVTGKKIDIEIQSAEIDPLYKSNLLRRVESLRNPKISQPYQRGKEQIKAWFTRPGYIQRVYAGDLAKEEARAYDELHRRLRNGEDYSTIITDMKTRYDPTVVSWDRLTPLWDESKPATADEVEAKLTLIKTQLAAEKITADEYRARRSHLIDYLRSINQRLREQKDKESKK